MKKIICNIIIIIIPLMILWTLENIAMHGNEARFYVINLRYMFNYISNMNTLNMQESLNNLINKYDSINQDYINKAMEYISYNQDTTFITEKIVYYLKGISFMLVGIFQYVYVTLVYLFELILNLLKTIQQIIIFIFNPVFINLKNYTI